MLLHDELHAYDFERFCFSTTLDTHFHYMPLAYSLQHDEA